MRLRELIVSMFLSVAASAAAAGDIDYTKGVFVINEDWFGHQNSTLNYLLPDEADGSNWHYRVIQTENPGVEIGCTAQFAAIHNGRIYIVAKQDKDNGATISGGRLTIVDATTMKVLKQLPAIATNGCQCDGRSFLGVDDRKGYVSTSNGVWILNLATMEIERMIPGTGNESGNLYRNQCGSMVKAGNRVFIAHQTDGLIVVDSTTDEIETTLSIPEITGVEKSAIGSVVRSKDGSVWMSVAKDTSGSGSTLPMIVCVDPETLAAETVDMPDGTFPPSNSWYAWTPDGFSADAKENALYWNGGANSWFTGTRIFKMNVDTREVKLHIDYTDDPDKWQIYGCSMRPDPRDGDLYVSLYKSFSSKAYTLRRYSAEGVLKAEYPMIENYWFPSIPFFPAVDGGAGVEMLVGDAESGDIYSIAGVCVARGCSLDSLPELTPGVYVFRTSLSSKKIVIK